MGNNVRIELPEERQERHRKSVFKPVAYTVLAVAALATVIGLSKLMGGGSVVSTTSEAGTALDTSKTEKAQPIIPDSPGRTVVIGPDEIPSSLPGEGRPVLPPGTSTLPTRPGGAATSDAGGVITVNGHVTGLMAIIGDQEPAKYNNAQVAVAGALVQRLVGDRAFALGPSSDDFIVVEFPGRSGSAKYPQVRPGAIIAVAGTLRQVPTTESADRMWGLFSPRPDLGKARLYIEATQIGPPRA